MAANKYLQLAQRSLNVITHKALNNFNTNPLSNLKVISATADGSLQWKWTVHESHLNRNGELHGGLVAGIIDLTTGISLISMEGGGAYTSVEINVSYLRSIAENEETIDIHSKVTKRGNKVGFTEATILNRHGDIVATGKQTAALFESTIKHLEELERKCALVIEKRKKTSYT